MTTSVLDRELHTAVLKREEVKEKAYRDERNKQEDEFHSNLGMGGTEMTKTEIRKVVDSDRRTYYHTDALNSILYIHYKGWRELKNLEGWTGLKSLYAECNAFAEIQGLQNCRQIRSLFLQENAIQKISGLETLTQLWTLNLASNFIRRVEGLSNCKELGTLILSKNKLGHGGVADLEQLAGSSIHTLDIQDNKVDDPDMLPEVLARMKKLRVLYTKGNPSAKKIVNYRRSCTVYCKELTYLDDRPVFVDDRRQAEAFNRGGIEEQRAEQKRCRQEKNAQKDRGLSLFQESIEVNRQEKRETDAMRMNDKFTDETDPVESREKKVRIRLAEELRVECEQLAKERAERQAAKDKADAERKATADSRETSSGDTDADIKMITGMYDNLASDDKPAGMTWYEDRFCTTAPPDTELEKMPKDNRKLVYDDIWDDKPSARSEAESARSARSVGAPASLGPSSGSDVFLPWAEGAMGMDALPPSKEVLEKRMAALQAKAATVQVDEAAVKQAMDEMVALKQRLKAEGVTESRKLNNHPEIVDLVKRLGLLKKGGSPAPAPVCIPFDSNEDVESDGKPCWHSKYLEQYKKTQAAASASAGTAPKAAFAPPPRRQAAAPAAAPEDAESSQAMGVGELDEMD